MEIYNTLTRKKEEFKPLKRGEVSIYVCGPTVYDYPHIGHARTYMAFDCFVRYLRFKGYKVKYVMNITNVDDKIIDRAVERGEDPVKLANKFGEIFFEEIDALGIARADAHPRVTEHIPEIIETIQRILDNGCAYVANGDVYFSVDKVKEYGKLSHQRLKDMIAGARVEIRIKKRHPMDFALWKQAKEGEPSWTSPWGKGRPGWHIECSTMSSKYLGEQFDIHGGALDLIFPHHENEILQSEAATSKKPFVKYWMHTGFLNVEGAKMSKSLGNFITIRELLEKYDADSFRFLVLLAHYRSAIDFSYDGLEKAKKALERIHNTMEYARSLSRSEAASDLVKETRKKFFEALDDDFNTPKALAVLFDFCKEVNKLESASNEVLGFLEEALEIFGLSSGKTLSEASREKIAELIRSLGHEVEDIGEDSLLKRIAAIRDRFREKGDYNTSDDIRKKLEELGITLEDTKRGTIWKIK
ncbi:MAG: cysteine--tRNA ligase [Candidatus Hydrothermarchaeales archaeon]